jgi:hypothetical protein
LSGLYRVVPWGNTEGKANNDVGIIRDDRSRIEKYTLFILISIFE